MKDITSCRICGQDCNFINGDNICETCSRVLDATKANPNYIQQIYNKFVKEKEQEEYYWEYYEEINNIKKCLYCNIIVNDKHKPLGNGTNECNDCKRFIETITDMLNERYENKYQISNVIDSLSYINGFDTEQEEY